MTDLPKVLEYHRHLCNADEEVDSVCRFIAIPDEVLIVVTFIYHVEFMFSAVSGL
jgi:hypothetical protein